ncbi:hypothetical protein GGR33_003753 [Methylobacterium brachythecii]|uniref:Uncharacterized protein n=1 Tax=Methylobacterium brachythecii TaxID=1176177 RepID=A0A7W6F8A5_9HYPH|nr:hypothetical protein [Methylobacterium brachythecii]
MSLSPDQAIAFAGLAGIMLCCSVYETLRRIGRSYFGEL